MTQSSEIDLLQALRALAPAEGGVREGESLVVGFSGGADSTALLDLLHRLSEERSLRLIAAHLDHGIRSDSAEDATFCARFCAARQIPFRTHRIEVAGRPERRHVGLEGAARQVRLAWLEEVKAREGFDRIALAHHLDDHVETLLLWLFRGTGLSGMRGIAAARGDLVRPLRGLSRQRIRDYLQSRRLQWREDETNASASNLRSRVRHELLPQLRDLFDASAPTRLTEFARRAVADLETLEAVAEAALERCGAEPAEGNWTMRRAAFLQEPQAIQFYVVRQILLDQPDAVQSQRWNEPAYQRVLEFARDAEPSRKAPLPGGGWLHVSREELFFELSPQTVDMKPDERFRLDRELLPPVSDGVRFSGEDWAYFDADCIEPPVRLSLAAPGDQLLPRGMSGRKKLSALFRERGIPLWQRPRTVVVRDARRIIWVVGIATAGDTIPTARTKQMMRLTLRPIEPTGELGTDSASLDR